MVGTMKVVPMERERELCDPYFSGYKLSLERVAVQSCVVQVGPSHLQPSIEQYSFLNAKLFGEQNHFVADPWSRQDWGCCVLYLWGGAGGEGL